MELPLVIKILNILIFVYACTLFISYIVTALMSTSELKKYHTRNRLPDFIRILSFPKLPSISVVAPAYNEERTIIENINCLLSLKYPNFEIVIVNDGSKDQTLQKIISYFNLVKTDSAYEQTIETKKIRGVYKSQNNAYNHLTIIDKENGGKADALNAGLNYIANDLFLAVDVDTILEPDALLRMVKPFIEETKVKVIASGGVIRVANSCEVRNGRIVKVNFPKNIWAKYQTIEYFRAFTLGRMAWSRINGLLIISGAFGLFDRKTALDAGGYDTKTVGEDLELVVRMRRYMHEVTKEKYKIAFIPDPLCWTEVPESLKVLSRQRNRWTRGAIETIRKHLKMTFNPKFGRIGMISFPYWIAFEWLAPLIQVLGIAYVIVLTALGLVDFKVFLIMTLFVLTFAVMYAFYAVLLESIYYNKYKNLGYLTTTLFLSILEVFVYQPMNTLFSLQGNIDYFFRKKNRHAWGNMQRKGFASSDTQN